MSLFKCILIEKDYKRFLVRSKKTIFDVNVALTNLEFHVHITSEYICSQCHGVLKERSNLQQSLEKKWGWLAYMTSTVCDICIFAVLCSVTWPFFVASLVCLKGTPCCVIRRNFKWNWAVRSCYGKVLQVIGLHDFRCYLLSLRGVWHLCNLPCVYALFWLVSISSHLFKSPSVCFRGVS